MVTAEASPIKTAKASVLKRAPDWIWKGKELRALRAERPKASARQLEFLTRSKATLAVARAAVEPPLPSQHGPMDGVACELYREAVYWGLMAQRVAGDADAPRENLEALFKSVDRSVLELAAGNASQLEEIERAIATKDFADLAELSQAEQVRLAQSVEPFAEALSMGIAAREMAIQRIWTRRTMVLGVLVLLVWALIWLIGVASERAERKGDLARGKPWAASSTYGSICPSPHQTCPEIAGYFFHTALEKDPWLVVDLEAPVKISGVRVLNRTDCCAERTVSLVVEVSTDQTTWKEMARRTNEFQEWKTKFPTTLARYVRFRLEGTNMLHLSQVRILP